MIIKVTFLMQHNWIKNLLMICEKMDGIMTFILFLLNLIFSLLPTFLVCGVFSLRAAQ